MAIIMITHDLGVVAGIADRINVMYAGYIVETGTVDEIFHNPRHPYTLGLLKSIPRLDEPRKEKLVPIEGLPPDLVDPPPGCPFQPRCPYAVERCVTENPRSGAGRSGPPDRLLGRRHRRARTARRARCTGRVGGTAPMATASPTRSPERDGRRRAAAASST